MTEPDPIAAAAMRELLSGDMQRRMALLFEHLSAVQRMLPRADQQRLIEELGGLLEGTD
jgi:hypothetical protein